MESNTFLHAESNPAIEDHQNLIKNLLKVKLIRYTKNVPLIKQHA